ncbi:MAG: S41 family peptidase [Planctomycetes bacterium]|nr:S41 family peptidase [Planctomycetota bacterium]
MRSFRFAAALALCSVVTLLAPARFCAADAAGDVARILSDLSGKQGDAYWDSVRALTALGKDAVPAVEEAARTRPEAAVKIACANALFLNGRRTDGVSLLMDQIEEGVGADRQRAADLLSTLVEGRSEYGNPDELGERLQKVMDDTTDAALMISCSKALFRMTGDTRAVSELKDLLETSSDSARIGSAIALAELDNFDDPRAMAVLESLKDAPTPRGMLVASLLTKKRLSDKIARGLLGASKTKYDFKPLEEIFRLVETRHVDGQKYPAEKLLEAACKGVGSALDPFSEYLTEADKRKLLESIQGKYGGIGAYVHLDEDKWLVIDRPIYSGPAYKAGLRSGDKVTQVEGEFTRGKTLDELVGKLKGVPGTNVKIKVFRRGWKEERAFELTRAEVVIDTARSERLPGDVGYLQITSFGGDTAEKAGEHLKALQAAGVRALIIDLRGNPGGFLNAAVDIVDLFLESGKVVVSTKGRGGILVEKLETKDDDAVDLPIMCLVNRGSASASEIFSGAMQDHKRAIVIGEQSFGKGSVQHLVELTSTDRKTCLRLTVQKYFLPSGRSIHREERDSEKGGVDPDIVVKPEQRDLWRDNELTKIEDAGHTDKYLGEYFAANKTKLAAAAEDDHLSPEAYPGFDAFYAGLKTRLEKDDVRMLLRASVRRQVADERGREYLVDLQQDVQLQRAIVEAMKSASQDIAAVAEYRPFAHKFDAAGNGKDEANPLPK